VLIGVLTIELEIPHAHSLKEKRRVINRVRDRVRGKFNAAIAEVDALDTWNYAVLGVCVVSNERRHANESLSKIASFVETLHDFSVTHFSTEFMQG